MRHVPRESSLRSDVEPSDSHHPGKIKELQKLELFYFAERGGFEPPVRFPARMFSKHVVSATHPPLQSVVKLILKLPFSRKECKYKRMPFIYPNGKQKKGENFKAFLSADFSFITYRIHPSDNEWIAYKKAKADSIRADL